MTLQEYSDGLVAYLKENPEHGKLTAITAADDEGNEYNEVYYGTPSPGHFENRDWTPEEHFEEDYDNVVNSVCIN